MRELRATAAVRKKAHQELQRRQQEEAERQAELARKEREEQERLQQMIEERAQREVREARLERIRKEQDEALKRKREIEEKAVHVEPRESSLDHGLRIRSGALRTPTSPTFPPLTSPPSQVVWEPAPAVSQPPEEELIVLKPQPTAPEVSSGKGSKSKDKEVMRKVKELQKRKAELKKQKEQQAKVSVVVWVVQCGQTAKALDCGAHKISGSSPQPAITGERRSFSTWHPTQAKVKFM